MRTGRWNLYRRAAICLYRRLPFLRGEGFTPVNRVEYNVVNVGNLMVLMLDQKNAAELAEKNMLHKKQNRCFLGEGEIDKALTIKAHRFSKAQWKR